MSKDVELTATIVGGAFTWEIDGGPANGHKIHVAKGAAPETITFDLKDKTNLDLRFDCSLPFQVWEQNSCPPKGINTDQILVTACGKDKVTICDLNTGAARELHYQLNVVAKDGSAYPCDPIVDNGGGGPGFY
jgi:hypothetical protein